jgi:hypothetical protein
MNENKLLKRRRVFWILSVVFVADIIIVWQLFDTNSRIAVGMPKEEVLSILSHSFYHYSFQEGRIELHNQEYTFVLRNTLFGNSNSHIFGPSVFIFNNDNVLVDCTSDIIDSPDFPQKWMALSKLLEHIDQ